VSDIVRIKCAECADVELCVECFAEGVEFDSHKKDHSYSVIVRTNNQTNMHMHARTFVTSFTTSF